MSILDTYYTRPMPPPWSKPLDVDRLSEAEADIDFAVPLAELPRLRAQLAEVTGEVRGRVHFRRAGGIAVAELTLSGTARLVCQRCLEAMEIGLEATTEVG
ncbi:MAG: YceD family protein, partial [Steroidobacteraceae bacterium]